MNYRQLLQEPKCAHCVCVCCNRAGLKLEENPQSVVPVLTKAAAWPQNWPQNLVTSGFLTHGLAFFVPPPQVP